jgi:hypothetical protein
MTDAEIGSIVDKLTDIARILSTANTEDKSEIFRQLGLRLTYYPGRSASARGGALLATQLLNWTL